MVKRIWEKKEIKFLEDNHEKLSIKEIKLELGRSRDSIAKKAGRLGLRKLGNNKEKKICSCGNKKDYRAEKCRDCWIKEDKFRTEKQNKAVSKALKGKKSYRWKGGKPKGICEFCGKDFIGEHGNPNKYCSKECASKANVKNKEKNYFWKGGEKNWKRKNYLYSSLDWRKLREKLIKESKGCAICKRKENLHIHHKIRYKEGGKNTKDNLIVLCKYCHSKIHMLESFYINHNSPKDFKMLFEELKNKYKLKSW